MTVLALAFAFGCDQPFTLPSKDPAPSAEEIKPGASLPVRERQLIIPAASSGPAPPEPGITSGQCSTLADGGPVNGPDCVTQDIKCGETVIGHTRGGVNQFKTRFWEKNFCWPGTYNHNSGDERVYRLRVDQPADVRHVARFTLDTPCADLDMMVFPWSGSSCPTLDDSLDDCEALVKQHNKRESVEMVADGSVTWYVVIEGVDDEEGAFSLTTQCIDSGV